MFLFPFLGFFARVFQKYIHDEQNFALAVQRVLFPSFDFELALLALKQDLLVYLKKVISYNLHIWDFCLTDLKQQQTDLELILKQGKDFNKSYLKKEYLEIEKIQKELLDFLSKVHQTDIQKAEDADQVSSLYQVIIDIGDSSKYLKDVRDRVEDWQWSTSVNLQKDYEALRRMVFEFYQSVLALLLNLDNQQTLDFLHELLEKIEVHDKEYLTIFRHKEGDDIDLMKLIQVNRYFSMSCMALVKAIEHIRMDEEEKKYLKEHIEGLF